MKGFRTLLEFLVINGVLGAFAVLVMNDYAYRNAYWASMDFTPHTTRYPLILVTSATRGSTYIAGTPTVDWLQVIGVVLVFTDIIYVWMALRKK